MTASFWDDMGGGDGEGPQHIKISAKTKSKENQ